MSRQGRPLANGESKSWPSEVQLEHSHYRQGTVAAKAEEEALRKRLEEVTAGTIKLPAPDGNWAGFPVVLVLATVGVLPRWELIGLAEKFEEVADLYFW